MSCRRDDDADDFDPTQEIAIVSNGPGSGLAGNLFGASLIQIGDGHQFDSGVGRILLGVETPQVSDADDGGSQFSHRCVIPVECSSLTAAHNRSPDSRRQGDDSLPTKERLPVDSRFPDRAGSAKEARQSGGRDLRRNTSNKRQITTAGVDEAGRGPLAGPVVAAAVILDPRRPITGVADSKTMSAGRRQKLSTDIRRLAAAWALAEATAEEIDTLNILGATMLAMKRAVEALKPQPDLVLVDGLHCPSLGCAARAIVKGDASVESIAAASILAKVHRDEQMVELAGRYPGYGFERHKGYPTAAHIEALGRLGVSPLHRRSFAPVKRQLDIAGPSP